MFAGTERRGRIVLSKYFYQPTKHCYLPTNHSRNPRETIFFIRFGDVRRKLNTRTSILEPLVILSRSLMKLDSYSLMPGFCSLARIFLIFTALPLSVAKTKRWRKKLAPSNEMQLEATGIVNNFKECPFNRIGVRSNRI